MAAAATAQAAAFNNKKRKVEDRVFFNLLVKPDLTKDEKKDRFTTLAITPKTTTTNTFDANHL
jgi:hypothetical protein